MSFLDVCLLDPGCHGCTILEHTIIPWEGRREDGMTMKLALYCIALLANEVRLAGDSDNGNVE